jgi:hypothetical protein
VDWVHGQWTMAGSRGPPWTDDDADGRTPGHGGVLAGVWPPVTSEHESAPAMAQKREGSAGNLCRASLELRWWCGDRTMTMKRRRREDSVATVFELGGSGKVEGVGARRTDGGSSPFIGAGGQWGRRWPAGTVGVKVINAIDGQRVYGGC